MRVLVITDIHANLIALEAVLEDAGELDAVWCLGDVVGYGPNPNECINLLQKQPNLICLLGNHDAAAINLININTFNMEARLSVSWTQEALSQESITFLKQRPQIEVAENVTLVHGSPRQPVFEYLLDTRAATKNFKLFETDYCFVGHTHLPVMFTLRGDDYAARLKVPTSGETTQLSPRAILNPGSVGQPRDRNPQAAYAIFDPQALTWLPGRVSYDIEATQQLMRRNNLPDRHIQRLQGGW